MLRSYRSHFTDEDFIVGRAHIAFTMKSRLLSFRHPFNMLRINIVIFIHHINISRLFAVLVFPRALNIEFKFKCVQLVALLILLIKFIFKGSWIS